MARGYTSVSLPDNLLQEIDIVIKNEELGYSSRSEFIKEALRIHLIRIKFEQINKDVII